MKTLTTALIVGAAALGCTLAQADTGKLLLTGGVSSIDGAAGGGLAPWAVIGSQGVVQLLGHAAAHDQTHPRHGRAQRDAVVGGRTPDGQECLLQHIHRPIAVCDYAQGQP